MLEDIEDTNDLSYDLRDATPLGMPENSCEDCEEVLAQRQRAKQVAKFFSEREYELEPMFIKDLQAALKETDQWA